jgi:predicted  nucleic acid-binding Zn-ribbon protein
VNNLENNNHPASPNSGQAKWAIPVLGAAFVLSLGINGYQAFRLQNVNKEVGGVQRQIQELQVSLGNMDKTLNDNLGVVRTDLDSARKETQQRVNKAAMDAQNAARRHADKLVANLAKSEEEKAKQLSEDISRVKETTVQANSRIAEVSTDVGSVKQEVSKTQSELQATISDLRRATGDMGVMSGLIATNAKELSALRELGERNYVEFQMPRSGRPQKVGDILLAVKKTDAKRSKFTVDVIADDRTIEKRDRTANEPVQFYVLSKARQPYELVVNEVTKDAVKGYLAIPKVQISRR